MQSIKYTFLFPYLDRIPQTRATLVSLVTFYGTREDVEILFILDQKQTLVMTRELLNLVDAFHAFFKIRLIPCSAKIAYDPATAYNDGAKEARGDFLILSSPECQHDVDILKGLDAEFQKNMGAYVICSCKATNPDGSFRRWYQHSIHGNRALNFCTALSRENFNLVKGFNEEYTIGYGYDDDSFRDRVFYSNIPFVFRDDLQVTHQWHEKPRPNNFSQLFTRNKIIYSKERLDQVMDKELPFLSTKIARTL